MQTVIIVLACLISVLAGIVLCILGVFFYHLLVAVRSLNSFAEVAMESISPLLRDKTAERMAEAINRIDRTVAGLPTAIQENTVAMRNLSGVLAVFKESMFDTEALAAHAESQINRRESVTSTPPARPRKQPTGSNDVVVTLPQPPGLIPNEYAKEGESAVYSLSDEEAALQEQQKLARAAGIETDAAQVKEPSPDQMTGAEA